LSMQWLMAIITFVITLLIATGIFLLGRFVYQRYFTDTQSTITDQMPPEEVITVEQENRSENDDSASTDERRSQTDTESNNTDTLPSSDTAEPSRRPQSTPQTGPADLPQTGPANNL
jgi:cytoskeletal protein RodZ